MTNETEFNTDESARAALRELDSQVRSVDNALSESPAPAAAATPVDQQVMDAAEGARVETLRNRARKQRDRGIENLSRRHVGIASLMRDVVIKERVVGSTFERYFASIESGIYIITKLGSFIVGDSAADKLLETVEEKIKAMEGEAAEALGQMAIVMEAHAGKPDWLVPTYAGAAAQHQVQLRSLLANRLLNVLLKYDEQLVQLNQLVWNSEADAEETETREYEIKKQVRDLTQFIRRALVGMQRKTQPKAAPQAAAPATNDAPASAEDAPQALAA